MAAAGDQPLFFVFGSPRSGTTWLQKAIDAHPDLACLGEGKFLYLQRELGKACAQYSAFLEQYGRTVFGEPVTRGVDKGEFDQLYRRFIEIRLRSNAPDGVRRIGNKDPEHGLDLAELSVAFPDAAFIHLVRDPRDVAVSMWSHLRRHDPALAARYGGLEAFAPAHGADWAGYMRAVAHARSAGPLDFHQLRYEDLQAEPIATLAGVLRALGADASRRTVERCLDAAAFERSSGGRARGEEDGASFYRKGVVGDWRGQLTPQAAAQVLEAAGAHARELGYQ